VSWSVEQGGFYIFFWGGLGEDDCVGFFAFHAGVEVDDLDADFEVVQQSHHLYLVCLFVDLFDLGLAEEFDGDAVLDEGLVEHCVVLQLSRGEEAHHQDQVVGD
jgi:hypothetical protein